MRLMTVGANSIPHFSKLSLSLAGISEKVRETQGLRHKVFVGAMGLETQKNHEGFKKIEFDEFCDHLIVHDIHSLKAFGTCRVLGQRDLVKEVGRA